MLIWGLIAIGIALGTLAIWRLSDRRIDHAEMDRLIARQPTDPPRFTADMITDLPDPAQRFLRFAIAEGTPLRPVVRLVMTGQFAMGDKAAPGYMPMRATQVLAAPHGFVWAMAAGTGAMRLAGSDSGLWTRFWLWNVIPVARMGGSVDHARSAFGRHVAEAVFWTPAAMLPGPNVSWDAVSDNVARVTMRRGGLEQSVDVAVAADGRPRQVTFQRWSDANTEKAFRLQPFGGTLSEFRDFDGFRLPTRVEAGNHFGTDAYFPFYIAEITQITFPDRGR